MIESALEPLNMEPALQSILESLPPRSPRSKLEPHRELIRELRRKGRTYREVAQLFQERLGLYVAPSTLHSFVKVARNAHGEERSFTPAQTRSFSVYERQPIDVAPGDRLMLTANRRDADFLATNGDLVTVRGIERGRIQLEDGRALPANYHQFDHGYAITAHRSQGKTVDGVILSGDAMKQELFYVGASRFRSEIAIVTSDREQLRESLGISSARPSAMELAREQPIFPIRSAASSKLQHNKSNHLPRTTKSASVMILA